MIEAKVKATTHDGRTCVEVRVGDALLNRVYTSDEHESKRVVDDIVQMALQTGAFKALSNPLDRMANAAKLIVTRLAAGEDPGSIDPEYGCTNPLTGYFPQREVEEYKAYIAAWRAAN